MTIRTHELKVLDQFWEPLISGEKTFEVRRDDRGFQRGDLLTLRCFGHDRDSYLKNYFRGTLGVPRSEADTIHREITWIMTGGQFGIEPGYVVLGIRPSVQNG